MDVNKLLDSLNARSFALCGGYYEPKYEQSASDGALMLEARTTILALIARLEAAERDANKWRDHMANRNKCYDRRYVAQITIEGLTKSGDMLSASRVVDREMWDRGHINEIALTAEAAAAWFDAAMRAEDAK